MPKSLLNDPAYLQRLAPFKCASRYNDWNHNITGQHYCKD